MNCICIRKSILLIVTLLSVFSLLYGQKPVPQQAIALFSGKHPVSHSLFSEATAAKDTYAEHVRGSYSMQIKPSVFEEILQQDPSIFRLHIPYPFHIDLDLYRVNIYSPTSHITTSDGRQSLPNTNHLFYRGMVHGKINSLATVSIFEDHVLILYSDETGNHRIQKMSDGSYLAYADNGVVLPPQIACYVDDADAGESSPVGSTDRSMTGNCIEVYVEADYKSYQDNGSSVANTEAWVAALWNEVITLYENEDIPVTVSDIHVYTSSDPFAGLNTTQSVLTAFTARIDTMNYDGRLAHFMSTRNLGGGIAWLNVLCSTTSPCAVSTSLNTVIVDFPAYSWNVMVLTHEMGHNLGSKHTHACVWNGNSTQIDDCGNQYAYNNNQSVEGAACFDPANPIIPESGTIMSYCHAIAGVGIDFTNGFGPLPGNLIRSKYNNATCNTGVCSVPNCTNLTSPLNNAIDVDAYENISWASSTGAEGYKITVGTTSNGGEIVNDLDVGLVTTYNPVATLPYGAMIYVKVVPYNAAGNASGCIVELFTVEANIQPACTALTNPLPGSTDVQLTAILKWTHSVGAQTGYKITVGTSPTSGDIANNLDVGNVNFYDPAGFLPPATTIYVRITPYGSNGDTPNCVQQSFTTAPPVDGDLCNIAINLTCNASISGSTLNAYSDPEGISCGGISVQAPGIWYKFTGDGQNTIISLCSNYSYDTQVSAYSGTCTSLTCVAGNDDFCSIGSRLTFPTVSGTTYYILVHGWGGAIGNFTITRTCYSGPFYCQSGGRTANQEWIKTFALAGYQKQSGSSHCSDYTNETITLSRGSVNTVTITPQFSQSPKNEYYRVWIDFNKDGDFTDAGEQVFSVGPYQTAVSGPLSIPITVATGFTRMRVAMKRSALPTSCDVFEYGEMEEYTVNIRCNLVTSTTDTGNGSLRNVSTCADDNEPVLFAPTLNNSIINVTQGPIICDGQWKWMAEAGTNIQIKAVGITKVLSIPIQKSVEVQNLEITGGTATHGSAIDNIGTLTLRSSTLKRAPSTTTIPLQNTGSIFIHGICHLKI